MKRNLLSAIIAVIPGAGRRTRFMKKHHLYGSIGDKCMIQKRKLPLYSNLIYLHDNVKIASNVGFVTHDVIHTMLNAKEPGSGHIERVGCIEVMDNVFIGSGTRILYDTRIGSNVIIGSDSLVNKDIPDNSVYAGVPARFICTFDEYVEKSKAYSEDFRTKFGTPKIKDMDDALAKQLYRDFVSRRAQTEEKEG
ncbi:MAG: acyltransferase [Lachnospiraceae bacterium]|nr:acyltransferase [Lachnospiraceae bacterium]